MKLLFKLLAVLVPVFSLATAAPQPLDGLITAGTSVRRDAQAPYMAYLVWSAPGPVLPGNLSLSVWMQPNGTGNFVRQGIVQPVQDEPSVKLLMERSLQMGIDPLLLLPSVNELLAVWQPRTTAIRPEAAKTLPPALADLDFSDKVSRLLKRGRELAEAGLALRQMSTSQPVLRMALGQAWAGPLPAGPPSIFELRRHDPATGTDGAVMGRVTLTPGSGVALTTPLPAVQVPDLSPTGDMTIKLRWPVPDALRRQLHHTTGFLLHRVRKAEADTAGLPANATLSQILAFRRSVPGAHTLPSEAPILPFKLLTAAQAADLNPTTGDPATFFFADREESFTDGSQFYYYLTALDLLGRQSAPSPRVLGTAVRTIPPEVPSDLSVTDEVVTTGPSSGQRRLVLRWTANNNSTPGLNGRTAQRYAIYRGATTDPATNPRALEALEDPAQLALLTPIFITHAPMSGRMTWVDTGLLSTAPDGAKTRWYAVRAVHDTFLGPVFSAPCPPAFAAFRDRAGLPAPSGYVQIDCPLYGTRYNGTTISSRSPLPGEAIGAVALYHLRLRCVRRDRSVEGVVFSVQDGPTHIPVGPIKFGPGTSEVTHDILLTAARAAVTCQTFDSASCLSTVSTTPVVDFSGLNTERNQINFESGKWAARELNPDHADDALFLTSMPLSAFAYAGVNVVRATLGTAVSGRPLLIQRRTTNPSTSPWRTLSVLEPTSTALTFASPWSPVSGQQWRAYALPLPDPSCPCVHSARPVENGAISPVDVIGVFPAGTKEWRIYKQVDSGAMELHLHGTSTIPAADTLTVSSSDTVLPPQGATISYFLQCFESNGNPSPLVLLATITLLPDPGEPILETPSSAANGDMTVRWFCPRPGVKNFRVWLAAVEKGVAPPSAAGTNRTIPNPAYAVSFRRAGAETDENAWAIASYDLPLLTKDSTDTVFTQNFPVIPNQEYLVWVEAIGLKASTKNDSAKRLFAWKVPIDGTVAWPARPLPPTIGVPASVVYFPSIIATSPDARSTINTETMEEFPVGVRIGSLVYQRARNNGGTHFYLEPSLYGTSPEAFLGQVGTASGNKPALPAVLYRQTILPNGSPGNLIQTTPLREGIGWRDATFDMDNNPATPETAVSEIFDPYILVRSIEAGAYDVGEMYLVDSQPVELGATYRYFLVRYQGPGDAAPGEIDFVVDCGQITIPEEL